MKKIMITAAAIVMMTACKKEEATGPTGPSSCEQSMAATRAEWNDKFAVVDSLWQSGQIVDCDGYIGAMNYYIGGANNEGQAYSCGWTTIPEVTTCPPR